MASSFQVPPPPLDPRTLQMIEESGDRFEAKLRGELGMFAAAMAPKLRQWRAEYVEELTKLVQVTRSYEDV